MSAEWKYAHLGDIAKINTGKLDSNAASPSGVYPFFTCSPTTLRIDTYAFDTEAVILSGNNANGIFSTKYFNGKFNAYQRTYVIEPRNYDLINCKFLFFTISYMLSDLEAMSIGSATKFLTKSILNPITIPLPVKREQDAIADLLGSLDNRIQLLRETNATLEAIAQAMFKSWFVNFDPVRAKAEGRAPEGMDAATAALFPHSFEESELGMIPKGWIAAPIGDSVNIVGGGTPSTKHSEYWIPEDYSWTSPKDLSGASSPILLQTEKRISAAGLATISSGLLPRGTLLLSSRAPIGYLAITQLPVAINQGYIAVLPDSVLPPLFMFYWCKHYMGMIKGHANGSTFMEISKKAFRLIPAIIPSSASIGAFIQIADGLFERITANEGQARTLTAIRDTLLPRLITGELRLPESACASGGADL